MPGLLIHEVNSRLDRGTAQTVVIEIRVCGDCGFALHLAQEARREDRALRSEGRGRGGLRPARNELFPFRNCTTTNSSNFP
jgi:hypothetical protein